MYVCGLYPAKPMNQIGHYFQGVCVGAVDGFGTIKSGGTFPTPSLGASRGCFQVCHVGMLVIFPN